MSAQKNGQKRPAGGALPALDGAALAARLRRKWPFDTAFEVGRDAGIAVETVRNWLAQKCRPSLPHFLALAKAYGPEFVVAVMPEAPGWVLQAAADAAIARLDAEIAERKAALEKLRGRL